MDLKQSSIRLSTKPPLQQVQPKTTFESLCKLQSLLKEELCLKEQCIVHIYNNNTYTLNIYIILTIL